MHRGGKLVHDLSFEALTQGEVPLSDQLCKSRVLLEFDESARRLPSHQMRPSQRGASRPSPEMRRMQPGINSYGEEARRGCWRTAGGGGGC